jgi:hypothetical protein
LNRAANQVPLDAISQRRWRPVHPEVQRSDPSTSSQESLQEGQHSTDVVFVEVRHHDSGEPCDPRIAQEALGDVGIRAIEEDRVSVRRKDERAVTLADIQKISRE